MKIKTLIQKQTTYIFDQLNSLSLCKFSDKISNDKISTHVKEILQKKFYNGSDMKDVLCLFNTLIHRTDIKQENGMYKLSTSMKQWVKTIKKINVKSSEGHVYKSNILSDDIKVIIKTPKNVTEFDNLVREYYIGITEINKLRYIVPNFVYTLGAFLYPEDKGKNGAFVVYEEIHGITLEKALKENKLSFEQFNNIFIQLLLALEVGQRKCSFCHFDLHVNNVILRSISKPYKYTIVLDDKRYDIIAKDFIPVIIDFGTTTVKVDGTIIGSYYFLKYGMMNNLIQGADMYKLLVYSYFYAKDDIQRQIGQLFLFYGQYDPYKILITCPDKYYSISSEYVKKISFSYAGTFTPLEFINYINQQNYIVIQERNIYYPIKLSSSIFQENGYEKAIELVNSCNSYIILKYIQYITKKYKTNSVIQSIENKIRKNKVQLIDNDIKMLTEFTKIDIPDEFIIRDCINQILSCTITNKCDKKIIENFTSNAYYIINLSPYLQMLYTIRELKLEKIYKDFIQNFLLSKQYNSYLSLIFLIEKTRRWSTTLLESMF